MLLHAMIHYCMCIYSMLKAIEHTNILTTFTECGTQNADVYVGLLKLHLLYACKKAIDHLTQYKGRV